MTEHEALDRLRREVEAQGKHFGKSPQLEQLIQTRKEYQGEKLEKILQEIIISVLAYSYDPNDFMEISLHDVEE